MKKIKLKIDKDDMLVIALILAVILIAAIALVVNAFAVERNAEEYTVNTLRVEDVLVSAEAGGISVVSIDNISGMYVEDGSDEVLSEIFTVTFRNNSEKALQYAKLILTVGEESYTFEISTVPAGASVRAMEINRKCFASSKGESTLTCEDVAWIDNFSLCEGMIKITPRNNALIIENVSDSTITAPIYVYYKNYIDGIYVGGITYRIGTQQSLEPGQAVALSAKHFDSEASQIMFVTYVS